MSIFAYMVHEGERAYIGLRGVVVYRIGRYVDIGLHGVWRRWACLCLPASSRCPMRPLHTSPEQKNLIFYFLNITCNLIIRLKGTKLPEMWTR
jgi:hypothetical protein